jgi:hypothetical protein
MNTRFGLFAAPLAAALLAACTDSTGRLSLAVSSVRPAGATPSAALAAGVTGAPAVVTAGDSTLIIMGNDTVIVRSAQLVLREIELKRVEAAACDDIVGNDDCEEFETGPTLVTLPLGATATETMISVAAPAGMYDELEFEVHPSFDGASIRVTGTFSHAGTRSDFTFTSDLNAKQEVSLPTPLTVSDGQQANVTLRVDIATWFLNAAGAALVDPSSANKGQPNENAVRDRIQASIDAFRDDDHDGHDDDGLHH